jgi:hypothetical protein
MAQSISPTDITKAFTDHLVEKLTSIGPLVDLLNSHFSSRLSTYSGDPKILNYEVQLLAYEYALRVAEGFPTELAERLASTTSRNHLNGIVNKAPAVVNNQPRMSILPPPSSGPPVSDFVATPPPRTSTTPFVLGSSRDVVSPEPKENSLRSGKKHHGERRE